MSKRKNVSGILCFFRTFATNIPMPRSIPKYVIERTRGVRSAILIIVDKLVYIMAIRI